MLAQKHVHEPRHVRTSVLNPPVEVQARHTYENTGIRYTYGWCFV